MIKRGYNDLWLIRSQKSNLRRLRKIRHLTDIQLLKINSTIDIFNMTKVCRFSFSELIQKWENFCRLIKNQLIEIIFV